MAVIVLTQWVLGFLAHLWKVDPADASLMVFRGVTSLMLLVLAFVVLL